MADLSVCVWRTRPVAVLLLALTLHLSKPNSLIPKTSSVHKFNSSVDCFKRRAIGLLFSFQRRIKRVLCTEQRRIKTAQHCTMCFAFKITYSCAPPKLIISIEKFCVANYLCVLFSPHAQFCMRNAFGKVLNVFLCAIFWFVAFKSQPFHSIPFQFSSVLFKAGIISNWKWLHGKLVKYLLVFLLEWIHESTIWKKLP